MEDAKSSEKIRDMTGAGIDQDGLNELWQSFYTQNMHTLENVYRQVGEPLMVEMKEQIPNFDPEGEHKELFEASVKKNIPQSAEPYIMGIINGGLVALLEVGRRLSLDTESIANTLKNLNPEADVRENIKKELGDQDGVQEPIQGEG